MSSSYALGSRFEKLISKLVDEGRYGNKSEVVREGLRLLEYREERLKAELAALREGIGRGLDDLAAGRFTEYDNPAALADDIKQRGRKQLAKRKSGSPVRP